MAIPEQIVHFLAERMEHGVPAREPMLEVLARRHYREFDLHDLQSIESGERPVVVAGYTLDDRPTRLVSAVGSVAELADASSDLVSTVSAHVGARARNEEAVVDLYLRWPEAPEAADETSEQLRALVAELPWPTTYDGYASPSAPAANARSATTPSGPTTTARWSRTTSPVGCTRWSAGA